MRAFAKTLALSCSLLAIAVLAQTQKKEMSSKKPMSPASQKTEITDAEYTAQALSAAPKVDRRRRSSSAHGR